MRRRFVILICILNTLLAGGLLWFTLGSQNGGVSKQLALTGTDAPAPPFSDNELWNRAASARTFREAASYLARSEDQSTLATRIEEQLTGLITGEMPPFSKWGFYQAILQAYARQAKDFRQIRLFIKIVKNTQLPLILRDTAFRHFVENSLRLDEEQNSNGPVYALIDHLYPENNILSGAALQAEHFLLVQGVSDEKRRRLLLDRIKATLTRPDHLEVNQFIALNILAQMEADPEEAWIQEVHAAAKSDRIRTAVLQVLASREGRRYDQLTWLTRLTPSTAEQEQLIHSILDQK